MTNSEILFVITEKTGLVQGQARWCKSEGRSWRCWSDSLTQWHTHTQYIQRTNQIQVCFFRKCNKNKISKFKIKEKHTNNSHEQKRSEKIKCTQVFEFQCIYREWQPVHWIIPSIESIIIIIIIIYMVWQKARKSTHHTPHITSHNICPSNKITTHRDETHNKTFFLKIEKLLLNITLAHHLIHTWHTFNQFIMLMLLFKKK